jgi:hypothetical protein
MTVLASGSLGAGFIAFVVVLALCLAAVFLFRSMSKHLRKVPPTFDKDDAQHSSPDDSAN